jgi:hypothetical protein
MEKKHSKIILSALLGLILASCQKELSYEAKCGTVFKIDMLHAYIFYPKDSTISVVKQDTSFYIGKTVCAQPK